MFDSTLNPLWQRYILAVQEEVKPALGCTEPISLALAAAVAAAELEGPVERVEAWVSPNLMKNGLGVTGIHAPEPEFVVLQLRAVLDGFPVHAAKTGMLFSAGIINALADALRDRSFPLVVDPVSVSQSGSHLLREDAVEALKERMIPGCDLLTPNRPEAEMLTGMTISSADDAAAAGEALIRMGAKAVLIKGGHMESSIVVTDCLCQAGQAPKFLPQPKVETTNNHGTGCTLSAAIATCLGHGLPLQVAVTRAQEFLNLALRKSYAPGKGCGPVNHAARR